MTRETPAVAWYEEFFAGAALDLWRRAVPPETTEQEANFLHEVLAAPAGAKVLDVPCGNGRLSLPLSLMGYKVTGVDFCAEYVEEAKKSADGHKGKTNFLKGDMRELTLNERFDGAYCMGNSFGYLDHDGSMEFLNSVSKSLKSGAKFVIDSSVAAECFLVNGGEREWVQVGDMYMLIENRYNCRLSCLETTYTFIQNGKDERREALHWIFTCGEICRMLELSGFSVLELLTSTEFEPFVLGSERLLLISEKL